MAMFDVKVMQSVETKFWTNERLLAVCVSSLLMNANCAVAGLLGDHITPYVSAESTYLSNIFLLDKNEQVQIANKSQKWDILVRTDVGLVADIPIGRQTILADINVNFNQYQEYTFLDYVGANSKVAWNWVLGEHFNGRLGYNYGRFLTSFNNFNSPVQDITDNHNPFVEVAYRFHPSWEVAGGFNYTDVSHSNATRNSANFEDYTYTGELRYRNAARNFVGIQFEYSDVKFAGRSANQTINVNTALIPAYKRYLGSATVDWQLTGKSQVKGRIGYQIVDTTPVRVNNTEFTRNFNQFSWRFEYNWRPSAKTSLALATWREVRPATDPVSTFVKDTGVGLTPSWTPTEKISLRGEFSYNNQDYSGSVGNAAVANVNSQANLNQRTDDVYTIGIDFEYKPITNLLLELAYDYQNRSSNRLGLPYFYHTVIGGVRVEF